MDKTTVRRFGPMHDEPTERIQTTSEEGAILSAGAVVRGRLWLEVMGAPKPGGWHDLASILLDYERVEALRDLCDAFLAAQTDTA